MDLRNGTVDAPFGAHFAPVEDEFFSSRIQFHSEGILFLSFISVNTEIKDFLKITKTGGPNIARYSVRLFGKADYFFDCCL